MADRDVPINSGDEATNTPPAALDLDPGAQFRTLSKRLEQVADQVSRLERPKGLRTAEIIQLAVLAIALIVAIFTAIGLKDRTDDLVKAQAATETRLSAQVTAAETRINTHVDRLDDRIARIGDRTAGMEGSRGPAPR